MRILFLLFFGHIISTSTCFSYVPPRTWYVDAMAPPGGNGRSWETAFQTIQQGIDAAQPRYHDDVIVAGATYYEQVNFYGKNITVKGLGAIIDGQGIREGVRFQNNETASAIFEGFTITSCVGSVGAGIYIANSSPTIRDCSISSCFADSVGGGILINGSPIIQNCSIDNCFSEAGSGISIDGGSPLIQGCTIQGSGNIYTTTKGGGILMRSKGANPKIIECIINNCTANYGAGLFLEGFCDVRNCIIQGCSTWGDNGKGGGLYIDNCNPTIKACAMTNNSAQSVGGGIYVGGNPVIETSIIDSCNANSGGGIAIYGNALIQECIIQNCGSENTSAKGGGIYMENCSPTIRNCSFFDNYTETSGGGIYITGINVHPEIWHCIIAWNWAYNSSGGGVYVAARRAQFFNCIFYGNQAHEGGAAGGGVYGSASFFNCTFTANRGWASGGAISVPNWEVGLGSCIVWGNTAPIFPEIRVYPPNGSVTANYCDIKDGWPGVGNINADPAFLDEYHLSSVSPCIDTGISYFGYPDGFDLDGDFRELDGNGDGLGDCDMGADEYAP